MARKTKKDEGAPVAGDVARKDLVDPRGRLARYISAVVLDEDGLLEKFYRDPESQMKAAGLPQNHIDFLASGEFGSRFLRLCSYLMGFDPVLNPDPP